jgi:hypothetical protein
MKRIPPTSEVLFDIAQVSYDWWFTWPIYIPLLVIAGFLGFAYAAAETLPYKDSKPWQRVLVCLGASAFGFILLCCGIITWADWRSYRYLQSYSTHSSLQVVEGDYVPGKPTGNPDYGVADEPLSTFLVKTDDGTQTEFHWKMTRRHTLESVGGPPLRMRVMFIPKQSKHMIQRAVLIERLPPPR